MSSSSPGPEIHDFLVNRLANVSRLRIELLPVGREPLMAKVGRGLGVSLVSASSTGVTYPSVRFVPIAGAAIAFSAVWAPTNDNPALRRFLSDARLLSKRSSALWRTPDP